MIFKIFSLRSSRFFLAAVTASAAAAAASAAGFPRFSVFYQFPYHQHHTGGDYRYEQNIYKTHSHVLLSIV